MEDSTLRGKCKQYALKAIKNDPTLTLVRGHYHCPIWGRQAHWWTVRPDGTVYDPTATQFPSGGLGEYIAFNGTLSCDVCGKEVLENEAMILGNGHYATCSYKCSLSLVGLD